jgi:hypothetical protein
MKFEFSRQIFEKVLNIKFHQNPHIGSRVPYGRTDMTKLIVAFRNLANTPNSAPVCILIEALKAEIFQIHKIFFLPHRNEITSRFYL